jgi:hypothetical protein
VSSEFDEFVSMAFDKRILGDHIRSLARIANRPDLKPIPVKELDIVRNKIERHETLFSVISANVVIRSFTRSRVLDLKLKT